MNATAQPTTVEQEYLTLAADLDRWDGTVAAADALRSRLAGLTPWRAPCDGDVQKITWLQGVARDVGIIADAQPRKSKKPPAPLNFTKRWNKLTDRRVRAWSGVLMGAPERTDWPFDIHDLQDESPRKSETPMDSVGSVVRLLSHAPPRPDIVAFVACAFTARQRDVWLPASRAAASLACRSSDVHDEVARAWQSIDLRREPPVPLAQDDVAARWCGYSPHQRKHAQRHFLHLRGALAARGRALPGDTPEALMRSFVKEPEEHNRAVAMHGLAEIVRSGAIGVSWRPSIEAFLKKGIKENAGYQQHEGLRDLATSLEGAPELQHAVARLALRPPRVGPGVGVDKSVEAALAVVESARAFETLACYLGEAGSELRRTDIGEALSQWDPSLLTRIANNDAESTADPAGDLVERLACCTGPMLRTMPPARAVRCLAELILLFGTEENAELRWSDLVARAGIPPVPGFGPDDVVADVAAADLAIRMVELGRGEIRRLLHHHRPTRRSATVLLREALGGTPGSNGRRTKNRVNSFFKDQSAVAAAQLLYEPVQAGGLDMAEKVRLLWELLELDPPADYWEEVASILRGRDTLFHKLVAAIAELDASRPVPQSQQDEKGHARPFTEWDQYEQARVSLQKAGKALTALGVNALEDAMSRVPDRSWPSLPAGPRGPSWNDIESWRTRLGSLIEPAVAVSDRGSVVAWVTWLRASEEQESSEALLGSEVATAHEEVHRTLCLLEERGKGDRLRATDVERAGASVKCLAGALRTLRIAWPPQCLVDVPLVQLESWCSALARKLRQIEEREADLMHAVSVGDERAVLGLFQRGADRDSSITSLVSAHALKVAHEFLLGQMLYSDATRVRRLILEDRPQSRISSVLVHFAPLWSGVLGGGFFTLSLAKTWNDIAKGGGLAYYAVVVGALLGALAFLMYDLRKRIVAAPSEGVAVWWKVAARVAPAFGAATALAMIETALLLWVCTGTESVMTGTDPTFRAELTTAAGWRVAALWSAISLFGGIFVGLVAQGRGAVDERQDADAHLRGGS